MYRREGVKDAFELLRVFEHPLDQGGCGKTQAAVENNGNNRLFSKDCGCPRVRVLSHPMVGAAGQPWDESCVIWYFFNRRPR